MPKSGIVTPRDFGVFPTPRWLRRTEADAQCLGLVLNVVFALFSTFTVANLYYCQPILERIAVFYDVDDAHVSNVPTLTQAGYAIGLLFITPLGDLVRRRQIILCLMIVSTLMTLGLAFSSNLLAFEMFSFFVGMSSVITQILVPLVADLAAPERRASAISIIWSALMAGILLARIFSGVVANFLPFRFVYFIATALQAISLVAAYLVFPDYRAKGDLQVSAYPTVLWSMAKLAVTEPLLVYCSFLTLLNSACFTGFWVTLTFLLNDPPYQLSSLVIGLFGLLGLLGIIIGPMFGRAMDRVAPWYIALFAALGLMAFQAILLGTAVLDIAPVIVSTLGIDALRQVFQVSITTQALDISPSVRARANAVLSGWMFAGQIMGTASSTHVFLTFGWRPCYALLLGLTALQCGGVGLRSPNCLSTAWFGWHFRSLRERKGGPPDG